MNHNSQPSDRYWVASFLFLACRLLHNIHRDDIGYTVDPQADRFAVGSHNQISALRRHFSCRQSENVAHIDYRGDITAQIDDTTYVPRRVRSE